MAIFEVKFHKQLGDSERVSAYLNEDTETFLTLEQVSEHHGMRKKKEKLQESGENLPLNADLSWSIVWSSFGMVL